MFSAKSFLSCVICFLSFLAAFQEVTPFFGLTCQTNDACLALAAFHTLLFAGTIYAIETCDGGFAHSVAMAGTFFIGVVSSFASSVGLMTVLYFIAPAAVQVSWFAIILVPALLFIWIAFTLILSASVIRFDN